MFCSVLILLLLVIKVSVIFKFKSSMILSKISFFPTLTKDKDGDLKTLISFSNTLTSKSFLSSVESLEK